MERRKVHSSWGFGSLGTNDRHDIVRMSWKYLSAERFRTFRKERLKLGTHEIELMLELGQRRAKVEAAVRHFAASAELYVITQSREGFDRFIAFAEEWDCYTGDRLDRVVAHTYRWASSSHASSHQRPADANSEL